MKKIKEFINETGDFLYKYRYLCALIVFVACILFEISGSSIGLWKLYGMSDAVNDGVLLGVSREIRYDEWAVLTPMTFSQQFSHFKYFSDLIRGDITDVFIVFGLPVINFLQIFRPFQIGFLFLGLAKGLSFFWCGRFVALFLVMFELFMLVTNKNKNLSFIGAILITLSPIVQWWFAINGIVEIFVFGALAILLLDKYMLTANRKKRFFYLLGITFSGMCYILVFYPAWQIALAYVYLALAIWVIWKNWKKCEIKFIDIISIIIALILFGICIVYLFTKSLDTIKIVMNTIYPGSRFEVGGGLWKVFFDYPTNVFLPFKEAFLNTNSCEKAVMFTLFPMNIFISFKVLFKENQKDKLLILSYIVYLFFAIWIIIGFPEVIAKLSLMSNVQAKRAKLAFDFLSIIILIRSLSLLKKSFSRKNAFLLSSVFSIIVIFICNYFNNEYITRKMGITLIILFFYLFYILLRYKEKFSKCLFTISITVLMIVIGFTVNPIRSGVDVVYESSVIKEIQRINSEENGKWLVEGFEYPRNNFIVMAGVPVINCTNVYPNMNRWHLIDVDKKYENIYNRYAHINIFLNDKKNIDNKFELLNIDLFRVDLTPEELKKLDVKYIFTYNNLERFDNQQIKFTKISTVNNYNIYKLNY